MVDAKQRMESVGQLVVLAGATSRKDAIEALAKQLQGRGLRVNLAIGVERRMVPLLQVSFRHRGNAVYLLCGGPELPGVELERMVKAIRSNGAPSHCIWSGELDWDHPEGALREAEHRLAALGLDVVPEPPKTVTPVRAVTVVSSSPPPPIPSPTAVPIPAPTAGPEPSVPSPRTQPTPSVNVPVVTSASAEDLSDVDDVLELPQNPAVRFLKSPVGMGIAATVALLVAGTVAWNMRSTDDGSESEVRKAGVVATRSAEASEDEIPGADPETPQEVDPPDAVGAPAPAQAAPAEAAPAELVEAVAEADEVDVIEDEAEPVEALSADEGEDAALVYAALEKQSIRALDILLVSPIATKPRRRRKVTAKMRFEGAKTYCDELSIDGVSGWRLPDVGEAGWLSRANLLKNGVYWTSTKADAFGVERVVWNVRSRRMGATHTRWKGGRVVCVRLQRPADGSPG